MLPPLLPHRMLLHLGHPPQSPMRTCMYCSMGCCVTSVSSSKPDSTGAARLEAVQTSRHAPAISRCVCCCMTRPMMYMLSKGARLGGVYGFGPTLLQRFEGRQG